MKVNYDCISIEWLAQLRDTIEIVFERQSSVLVGRTVAPTVGKLFD